jgi:hypothetical protein
MSIFKNRIFFWANAPNEKTRKICVNGLNLSLCKNRVKKFLSGKKYIRAIALIIANTIKLPCIRHAAILVEG